MFYFLHSPLLPSLRTKHGNPAPRSPSLRAKRSNPATPCSRHCERSEAIQPLPAPVIASEAWQSTDLTPVIASKAKQSSNPAPRHCKRSEAIQPPAPCHCERSEAIQSPLPVIANEVKQSSTPGIKFGGSFYPSRQLGSQIWGSFLHHRPVRHPNLGVKLPVPRKLHTPLLSKPTNQSESPHLFFATPRGYHRESSTKRSGGREELARSV